VRELAALQTFPADIEFVGGRTSIQRQLGNAVPSLLAEILAREIARQLLDVTSGDELKLAVPVNRPIPPPEPVAPVLEKYLAHAGDHPDHDPRYLKTERVASEESFA
jgi:DNA (cytosine-5)-methyltransferase 1